MIDPAVLAELNDAITVVARFANSRQLASVHSARSGDTLSLSAIGALRQLAAGGPMRLSELAERLKVALPPLSRQLSALISAGYVVRTADARDARASQLALTSRGADALQRFSGANRTLLDEALSGWSEGEVQSLAVQMHRLVDDLRRGGPDGRA